MTILINDEALSETMKHVILKKVPEKRGKVHVLPNWADQNRIYPVPKKDNEILKESGLADKKIVMYSGNIGRYQPMEVMIQAAGELKHREDIAFVFAGDGGKKNKIEEVLDDEARAAEMGENGRRYFLEHFERKKITWKWKDLLISL